MADPYLPSPKSWLHGTLQPDPARGLITKVTSGGTPSTSNEAYWDGGIPWLTPKEITDMQGSLFVSRTERTITELALKESSTKLLPVNTVLLTKRAPVGAVAVNAVPMADNQGFLNFQCGPLLRPIYLAYWLKANTPYLEAVANGSTYPELYVSDLFEFEIAVPTLEVQDRIISVLNAIQLLSLIGLPLEQSVSSPEIMLKIQNQNKRLQEIKAVLMPLLLSGELDVENVSTDIINGELVNDR